MKESLKSKYKVVIGLEVHAQLLTSSKMFANDGTVYGDKPNRQVSVVSLAHPGTLPKVNKHAFEHAIKMGIACHSEISRFNIFDRKNYFYPDLPKGYQLTQDRTPICKGGFVNVSLKDGIARAIKLNRIHLEEDAGKSIHLENESDTLVDFNRAGVPLIEIVTEPVIHTSEEAYVFLSEIRKLVRYLDVCDGNMEEGSLRCDANVSIMLAEATEFGKKVEIKNMNSIRNVQRAIDSEVERQISALEAGEEIRSETRTFDAATGNTYSMRTKEELNDYRYFPDPDLSPVIVSDEWLQKIESGMPALPWELEERLQKEFGLPAYDAQVLTESKEMAVYFLETCNHTTNYKAVSNWIMGPIKSQLNELSVTVVEFSVRPVTLASLIKLIDDGLISFTVATQRIFPELMKDSSRSALEVAQLLNVMQDRDQAGIEATIEQILAEFPLKVEEYKKGKKGLLAMFMGEVMKRSKGKADPKMATEILTKRLEA